MRSKYFIPDFIKPSLDLVIFDNNNKKVNNKVNNNNIN